jgi:DNA mismatch repair protein MutS
MSNDDITPIRQQYLEIKRQYPDAILFFRLGDFYETFDQDAETVSRELDIVLTSRPIGKGLRAPLAGIPYHAIDNYLSRMISKGYHVAICEQMGDQPEKGIFPRKVVRVVTPGTILEPGLLPGDANNYLSSIVISEERAGIAFVDITTGEFAVTEIDTGVDLTSVRSELTRLNPAETIFPDNITLPNGIPGQLTKLPAWRFEMGKCREILLSHFQAISLEGFGLNDKPIAICAAGAILQYLKDTEPASLALLGGLRVYSLGEFMVLDASTRRNLELTETLRGETKNSLLGVLDQTVSPMGKRLMRQWINQPLLDIRNIIKRQDGVQFFFDRSLLRAELRNVLSQLNDLERLTNRIITGNAQPRDLVALRETLLNLPLAKQVLFESHEKNKSPKSEILPVLQDCASELNTLQQSICDDPPATLQNTGIIRAGFSSELDGVIEASRHAREWINNLESTERIRTGIKTMRVGYNKIFGYYIEVSNGQVGNVPADYIRKQTLVNAERFITPEMKEYETLVLNAEERIHEIEQRLFKDICTTLSKSSEDLLSTARSLAEIDVLSSLAEIAALSGYTRPEVREDGVLDILDGRHPVVETTLHNDRYVPNDISFGQGEIIRVITGPNMSGKSTYLRQAALIVLLAQIGSFVPAGSAKIGLVDRIFTRIGAQDEIHAGQSTFMVEMIETSNILHHATPRSLLILDELGRGTSTYDGVSIAWAVIEYIHNHPQLNSKTLFATHYHELTQLADLLPGIRNYNVAVTEVGENVVFLHKIIPGGADRSYGIHVAQLAGMPQPVIKRAGEIMTELEETSGSAIKLDPNTAKQAALFPETSPLLLELKQMDVNSLSPIEALNKLFEWQKKYTDR